MGKLIRLELHNFKSYKGHHTLLFGDSYFTSIIGPNGSGKSNSMDAISFVLGIKSSHLRSAHLKDLVYRGRVLKTAKINDDGSVNPDSQPNGTSDKGSKGEKGDPRTAWVMAVYVDDADDVHKWKRSITSSGVSEYRINDRVVTAQQYNEALEAENILIKARNFLVFQGDVEAIASQSPQDLTHLIEQISGSLEFKPEYERLQALQEQAAENLTFQLHRRRGINTEIKQYREQKKEAENFQNKLSEKDAAIVTQTLWKLYHFQAAMDEATDSIDVHQEDLKNLRRNVEAYEHRLETSRREHQAGNRQVGQVSKDIKAKEKSIEDKENSIVPYDEKLKESGRQLEVLKTQTTRVEKERDERVEVVNKVANDLKTVEKAEQVFEVQTEEQMKKQGRAISAADRREYDSLQSQVEAKAATNQSGLQHLERSYRAEDVTVKNLKGKVDRLTATLQHHEAELSTTSEKRDLAQADSVELTKRIASKKKEYTQRQSQRVQANQKRTDLEEKLQDVLTKLREVDDGRRQNAKEARIKDTVASLKSIFSGVRGRVGDLCKPKQKKFEEAVLVALGSDFDSIVVDTEKTASDCIAYLKEQRIPSMRFIPLDNIKVHAVNTAVKGINGVRLTIDTINFESSVERAISYACGNSVVCDTLEIAKHICYEKKISVEAVTLDGFVIHESGTMTGGRGPESTKNKRKFEDGDVQNLQRMVDRLKNEIESLPRAERAGDDEEALQTELAGLERRLALVQDELGALKRNYASKKREIDSLRKELSEQQPKYEAKATALEELSGRVQDFKDEISRVEDEVFAEFCSRLGYADVRAYRAFQGQFDQEVQQKRNDFTTQKQQLKSRLSWEQDRHKATEQRLEKTANSARKLKRDIKQYTVEKAEVEEELRQEQAELGILTERLEEYKAELTEKAEKVNEARAELQKRSKDIDSKQREVDRLEVTVKTNSANKSALLRRSRLEQIQIPLLKGTLDDLPNEDDLLGPQDADAMDLDEEDEAMMNVALDDHGIDIDYSDLEDAYKESDGPEIESELAEKITKLSMELEKLNPNMRAMERLESVQARLSQTDAEFEAAKTAAHDAKAEFKAVKDQRFDKFNEAFTHIQKEISVVYKNLTRSEAYPLGGQAYLDIEEDTDMPYLSGIKYHAMPPLKRFRDMEHLSGGEKTMAALALLFAIHSWRASPFFVLDEVDAALDNANVEKIKKYIHDHSGPGMQFIVISLKPGLFQDSESLCGIYRDQEVNSSRALTLDLRKYV